MKRRSAFFCLMLPLPACSNAQAAEDFCGESFCLRSISPDQVRRRSPVEDFTLYDVTYRNRHFRIYEGDNPRAPGAFVRTVRTRLPASQARLFRKEGQIEIYVDREAVPGPVPIDAPTPPPEFLHIATACRPDEECGIEDFASLLQPRGQHQ